MKTILWLKRFDLIVQLGALCIPVWLALADGEYFSIFYTYFFVGGAQVLSTIAHAACGRQQWTATRRVQYGRLLGWTLAIGVGVVVLSYVWAGTGLLALILGFVYLLATPLMAIWYFIICLREEVGARRAAKREMLIVRSV